MQNATLKFCFNPKLLRKKTPKLDLQHFGTLSSFSAHRRRFFQLFAVDD
jgi:hypothetical protein